MFFRFDPPIIPKDFVPRHTFPAPLDIDNKLFVAPPPEIPPPEDNNLKILIEGVATIVARCGKLFEDLSREKNLSNPLFSFLNGGNGHDYYSRKLWEEQQKRNDQRKQQLDGKVFLSVQKMTAESRGKILGEKPLESSSKNKDSDASADIHLQFNLSDTFTKPASLVSDLFLWNFYASHCFFIFSLKLICLRLLATWKQYPAYGWNILAARNYFVKDQDFMEMKSDLLTFLVICLFFGF